LHLLRACACSLSRVDTIRAIFFVAGIFAALSHFARTGVLCSPCCQLLLSCTIRTLRHTILFTAYGDLAISCSCLLGLR
jgi:hypothetical protein